MKIESIENGVIITVDKKENYTLEDLKQKIVNYLYNKNHYEENEIKLLTIVLNHGISSSMTVTKDSILMEIKED